MGKKPSTLRTLLEKTKCFFNQIKLSAINIYKPVTPIPEYVHLAPINDVKDCDEHIKMLQEALGRPQIKNIALSGPYGSGKSSIIQTFLDRNPLVKEKSILISLAAFSDMKADEWTVEDGILKQLFYKVEQKNIPQSRYRKIHRISSGKVFGFLLAFVALLFVILFIFAPSIIESTYNNILQAGAKINAPVWVSIAIFLALLLAILFAIGKFLHLFAFRYSLKDIKLPKELVTASIAQNDKEIFNKNIDEIVYFFEETPYRIVFFEDLDRFSDAKIFVKLRELNTLLNNYDAIKERVIFVYAVKDDLFSATERTKFFDFIIPVIPVINSTNSSEVLLDLLQVKNGKSQNHNITRDFLLDVSPFISDMRDLYNIYNEFLLFKKTIMINQNLSSLKDEVMLSLIIFKNLQPCQFAQLQKETGPVKEAFALKSTFIERRTSQIHEEIAPKLEILKKIDKDNLNSVQELKFAMLCAISNWKGMATSITRNGYASINASQVLDADFDFSPLLQQAQWSVSYVSPSRMPSSVRSDDVHEICQAYADRLEYLQHSSEDRKKQLREEIAQLEAEAQTLSSRSLEDLLSNFGINIVFGIGYPSPSTTAPKTSRTTKESQDTNDHLQTNDLLLFMLRKGYINESYADYINFFKGNSMTAADRDFILSIKTQKPKEFSYPLSQANLPIIIESLQPHEFSERAALNFNLLEFMLSNNSYDNKLDILMGQLSNDGLDYWAFVNQFADITKREKRFTKKLAKSWPEFWDEVYNDSTFTYDRKLLYLSWLCIYLNGEELCTLNTNGNLAKFFVENEDILKKIPIGRTQHLTRSIEALGVKFKKIDITDVSHDILDFVFDGCHYEINPNMIHSIVEYKASFLCDSLSIKSYTALRELGYTELLEYINKNFESYVDQIVLSPENTQEDSQAVVAMFERLLGDLDRCNKIIAHIDFSLESITDACGTHIEENPENVHVVWNDLLACGRLDASWENISTYWKAFGLTAELCNYIETNVDVLAEKSFSCLEDAFKQDIILSNMDSSVFREIIFHFQLDPFEIDLDTISKEKLAIMISAQKIPFTPTSYSELEAYAPELCASFVLHNPTEFDESFDEIPLSSEVFEVLMLSNDLSASIKERIVKRDGIDLMTKDVAMVLCSSNIPINRDLFASAWEVLESTEDRKKLLFQHLKLLKIEDFESYLITLGSPYEKLKRVAHRHEEILPDTEENRALVYRLLAVQYLTSKDYEIRGNKPFIRCRVKAK